MFQREVAERIVATPAERADYGRLGVLAGWRTRGAHPVRHAARRFRSRAQGNVERRRAYSAREPDPCDAATLSALTQAAFGQRRKMLRQSLKGFAAARGLDLPALIAAAGLEPTMRAEEVPVAGFVALARAAAGAIGKDQT